jgi:hypothetical protein
MLRKYDKDESGYLTEEEFLSGILVDPSLMALKSFDLIAHGWTKN